MSTANKSYFTLAKLFGSKILYVKSKSTLYQSYLPPVIFYGCKIWSVMEGDEEKVMTFERKILRHINRLIIDNGEYRMRSNKEIYQMYVKSNIKAFIRGIRLE